MGDMGMDMEMDMDGAQAMEYGCKKEAPNIV
jgi:hypothetical protein